MVLGEFFLAAGDEAAVRVGPGRRHEFPAVPCDGIFPDDAVLKWETLLPRASAKGPVDSVQLREVVPMANDGFTVFAIPDRLCTALVSAGTDRLRTTAVLWAETSEPDDEISLDRAVDLLERLSVLAGRGVERNLNLYCWYFAP
ncbi:hypothetical protein [Streptomyces sp. NPDC057580]|uniref:hypothetical protein n=1 Tax=Streptomyces sp. NPDC057580 TaxID=3346173 RepID=UPI0036B0F172